ncbi:hypothetical protein DKE50_021295 (plasmid) [Acinetobacter nosocomialis]|nr:hypothetical protein DKE50_021295 [Acinetobacter nosocomialis]
MNDTENQKKLPFSEDELLENIDEYKAHADEIAVLTETRNSIIHISNTLLHFFKNKLITVETKPLLHKVLESFV